MSGCMSSMFQGDGISFCTPLNRLKEEHVTLNLQKKDLYTLSTTIEQAEAEVSWCDTIKELRGKVQAFIADLDPHSEREEGVLFPMMAKYIGKDAGPIAVMEYEHEQAKLNIALFLEKTVDVPSDLNKEDAKQYASYITNAYLILTDHFAKEENVLFPMAEKMLTDEEKDLLERKMNEI
ncbi:hemerythrin domain-containing protein [Cytobacillus sp. S13-E01]|uniref:hemerythrin domain-containing protein n=1 Tax=Cytobacillus sp. S13-E01 TaxID=3031326 RepID=UPI0023D7EF66|nr:hemerythrin domain-containing protein [Cytobacillus sp. S13-E01]MDF0726284.1 hemerythrin domain-containing protein [Cytobacillus sp. S13-E01]